MRGASFKKNIARIQFDFMQLIIIKKVLKLKKSRNRKTLKKDNLYTYSEQFPQKHKKQQEGKDLGHYLCK